MAIEMKRSWSKADLLELADCSAARANTAAVYAATAAAASAMALATKLRGSSTMVTQEGNTPAAADEAMVPGGWWLAPIVPDPAMIAAGTEARWRSPIRDADNVREIWNAMRAATQTHAEPSQVDTADALAYRIWLDGERGGWVVEDVGRPGLTAFHQEIEKALALVSAAEDDWDRDHQTPPAPTYSEHGTITLPATVHGPGAPSQEAEFPVGTPVQKYTGEALWEGVIVASYLTTKGKQRYVVEVEPQGFQMIAVPSQLRRREP